MRLTATIIAKQDEPTLWALGVLVCSHVCPLHTENSRVKILKSLFAERPQVADLIQLLGRALTQLLVLAHTGYQLAEVRVAVRHRLLVVSRAVAVRAKPLRGRTCRCRVGIGHRTIRRSTSQRQ